MLLLCSNLPDQKVKHYERAKVDKRKPVVRPQWIVESLRAGKQLPVSPQRHRAAAGFCFGLRLRAALRVFCVLRVFVLSQSKA